MGVKPSTLAISLVLVIGLAGCTGRPSNDATGIDELLGQSVATPLSEPIEHIHGLAVLPDGTLRAGTHVGVRRITQQAEVTDVGPVNDYMGMTGRPGTRTLLSSGHPGPSSPFPNPVGFIRSKDGGKSWDAISLGGEVDFHSLATDGRTIVGFDGSDLLRSEDEGRSWSRGAIVQVSALTYAQDALWAATTSGIIRSTDDGISFSSAPNAPEAVFLASGSDGALWSFDRYGTAWTSRNGVDWRLQATVGEVQAVAAKDASTAFAITKDQLIRISATVA